MKRKFNKGKFINWLVFGIILLTVIGIIIVGYLIVKQTSQYNHKMMNYINNIDYNGKSFELIIPDDLTTKL